jgi:hypothetical protein
MILIREWCQDNWQYGSIARLMIAKIILKILLVSLKTKPSYPKPVKNNNKWLNHVCLSKHSNPNLQQIPTKTQTQKQKTHVLLN